MTAIDHQAVLDAITKITEYTPPRPPLGHTPLEEAAYLTGWHECTQAFADSLRRDITILTEAPREH